MQFLWHAVQQNLKAILFTKEQPLLCRWVEWDLHLHTWFFKFSWVLNLFKPSTCVNFSRIRVWVHITIHTRFIEDLHHLTQSDGAVLMPHTQTPPCIFTGQGLPNPFSGFLLFMSLANTSLVRQPLLLCNCRDFSFWVIAWNTENVNTMIQPLTGVNYPHFALLKREFLISKYCFFFLFFSFASSVRGLSHLRFSWGQSNFWHHTGGHHLDRKSSGNQSWYLCGML